jgi:2-keto-4-pentenoate hydratase/2-oxohepta-3-ene-1,7-dioic acid hydratase in catechol pathway
LRKKLGCGQEGGEERITAARGHCSTFLRRLIQPSSPSLAKSLLFYLPLHHKPCGKLWAGLSLPEAAVFDNMAGYWLRTEVTEKMKLVRYNRNDFESVGVLSQKGIVDISPTWPGPNPPRNIVEILRRDALAMIEKLAKSADSVTPINEVKLLAPIAGPGKIRALAGNFSEHIREASLNRGFKLGLSDAKRQTTVPRPFLKPITSIIGPDDQIPWPAYSEQIDYEIELAVVIGKKAKCVKPAESLGFVAGYTIANDVSARSVTFKKGRTNRPWDEFYDWLIGKWADGFCPMGPYLATSDEIDDVQNLVMELKVNGVTRQKAGTGQMIYSVADVVSFLSHIMTLEPGDVILTGTPAGVAVATGNFLKPGDKIECSIDRLGTLTNTIGQMPRGFYEPLA